MTQAALRAGIESLLTISESVLFSAFFVSFGKPLIGYLFISRDVAIDLAVPHLG